MTMATVRSTWAELSAPSAADDLRLAFLAHRELPLPDSAAVAVLRLDPEQLSQSGRLSAIAVTERAIAALTAAQAALVAQVAQTERAELAEWAGPAVDDPERELIAPALGVSPLTAANRVHQALTLRERLPQLWSTLREGRISVGCARVIADETACLSDEHAREVVRGLLPWAHDTTPGRVRRRAAAAAARVGRQEFDRRHEGARKTRRVVVMPEGNGMASLWWTADAATIAAARDLIDTTARANPVPEGIDAARSDALGALLLHPATGPHPDEQPTRSRPVVAVHVSLSTLLGTDQDPAEVPGLGAVPAEVARRVAADADWRAFLHSADGRLISVAGRAYTPTPAMAALVVARDRTCRFPGCAQPAHRCDLDHRTPYDHANPERGGPTSPDNLQALCRRHHNLKTAGTWSVRADSDGTLHWTGPRGTRARVEPDDPDPPW